MKKDLTQYKFGKLTVLTVHSRNRNGHIRWICQCECGRTHQVFSTHLLSGLIKSCGCDRKSGKDHSLWGGFGEISGNFWHSIKRGANGSKGRKPIEFSITIKEAWELFLRQKRKCALSGIELYFNSKDSGGKSIHTASLDRIDSGMGYKKENIQWVHKDINKMKNSFNQEYFISLCQLVSLKWNV